jgi:TRAP-type uncharacterized transport system fused permease subunit
MFVLYFATFADVTPPVAIASYAAAAIAKANPMRTGAQAFRLAIGGFVVGFSYLSTQALLLRSTWLDFFGNFVLNLVGLTLLAGAITGYFRRPVGPPMRAGLFASALAIWLLHIFQSGIVPRGASCFLACGSCGAL